MAATTENAVSHSSNLPKAVVISRSSDSNERKERHVRNRYTAEMEELRAK